MKNPIIEIHCDLLIYLTNEFASLKKQGRHSLLASLFKKKGNVDLQIVAISLPSKTNTQL